ncbi:hypothetical protein K438DRAFT_1954654 [Mycena galopus ATCC 62051]|nr:hypothetical protein K438DRAFT_1954654 [Mycena galopus ATCC 62051]
MVSALWKACSQGDLETVNNLLPTADGVEIEIKDHTGVTPLIEAVKNGHSEVVRALLDKGADPTNASSQGLPETYTADETILGMLNFARNKQPQVPISHENGYETNEANGYPSQGNYPYYPSINSAPPPRCTISLLLPTRARWKIMGPATTTCHRRKSPPPSPAVTSRRVGPLPPPAQYPTLYEQMPQQPYAPTYYPVPQPSFPPMNGQHPMAPPQGPPMHAPSPPEMMPPPPQGHFSPNGAPAMLPYGPISPIVYTHPGQAPLPMSIPPLPPLHHQPPPPPAPQSPTATFNPSLSPEQSSAFVVQQTPAPYPHINGNGSGSVGYPDISGAVFKSPQLNPQPEPSAPAREGSGARRGTARRGSFASRKPTPPCVFFPAGRCKNGTECRFPHVMPADGAPPPPFYPSRGGGPRRGGHANGNGFAAIEEKLALPEKSNDFTARGRGGAGGKAGFNAQGNKRASVVKQRVPNADEFPVLGGATTPPKRLPGANGVLPNGNGHAGPTAAQILQAPRPVRSNTANSSQAVSQAVTPRGVTPDRVKDTKPEVNGVNGVEVQPPAKLPLSFASIATAASDVAVSA